MSAGEIVLRQWVIYDHPREGARAWMPEGLICVGRLPGGGLFLATYVHEDLVDERSLYAEAGTPFEDNILTAVER